MKIVPDYQLSVLEEEAFREQRSAVAQQLDLCRKEGEFCGFDGKTLYYEYFQAEDSRGAVVIVHGLSEFTRKYHELAWYLLKHGYDVFLYDQRCHGRSCRLTDRTDLIHVDHFSDYRKDLDAFICNVVRPVTNGPLYLYAHSMGGAVAIQYLAEHPDVFQKAVLSAPMIEPLTGKVPAFVAKWGLTACLPFVNRKEKSWTSREFDPNYPFERSHDQSRSRFLWNMEQRWENPCYCTTPQTIRWVQQAVSLRRQLTGKRTVSKIRTPILMICADHDETVSKKAQSDFAKNCSLCRQVMLPNATHAMICGTQEIITAHVRHVLNHFA